ncbi:FISUMP domain-containing protein [Balneolaceae bacterium ANBcel3]|nr:FISUMP domain-containing protein [Balneolaceae bacterium ANBcel3]
MLQDHNDVQVFICFLIFSAFLITGSVRLIESNGNLVDHYQNPDTGLSAFLLNGYGNRVPAEEGRHYTENEDTTVTFEHAEPDPLLIAPDGKSTTWPRDTVTIVVEVTNPETGQIWMDRNLGAGRTATSPNDSLAFGDLYQWGRAADGHQKRNSSTTITQSNSDQPGHDRFITGSEWRSPQNDDLWQGVNGVNNPCPPGFRIPTDAEWNTERNSWTSNNAAGAFTSPLKLPLAGVRSGNSGSIFGVGSDGLYWSSSVAGRFARDLYFYHGRAYMFRYGRAYGYSVRCIKDLSDGI